MIETDPLGNMECLRKMAMLLASYYNVLERRRFDGIDAILRNKSRRFRTRLLVRNVYLMWRDDNVDRQIQLVQ